MTSPGASDRLDPAADPLARWQAVVGNADATPAEQARAGKALELADAAMRSAADPDRLRTRFADPVRDVFAADHTRARIAALWYQVLTDADAFAHNQATACRFDPAAVRAWLTGPDPADADTVAAGLGIGDDFDVYGFDKHLRLDALLAAAQAADMFGVPDHEVAVIHLAGEHGYLDRHRITLTTPQGGVLCSPDLDTADLLTDHLCGVDAAVHALGAAALHTDRLLGERALLPNRSGHLSTEDHRRNPTRAMAGKAFQPLGATTTPGRLDPPPLTAVPASPPRPHR
jgi:hypothetical protein